MAPLVAVAKNRELMQEDWQLAYCSVSPAVPLPCGHDAAHSVVALAWAALGLRKRSVSCCIRKVLLLMRSLAVHHPTDIFVRMELFFNAK